MPSAYKIFVDGKPADADLYAALTSLEVEENMDLPGAAQLRLPVNASDDGDLTRVNDAQFRPLANLAVVITPDGGGDQCVFDGYVLSHKLHLETGTANSTLSVWCQDATWMMNLKERVKEWVDVTDADVAGSVFRDYGIAASGDNAADDSPSHTEAGHSLMQRGSDIKFLRTLARRNGKVCRVACADTPGRRTGFFAKPKLDGDPAVTLTLNDPESWTVGALDIEWDVTRPTAVVARQALFSDADEEGVSADTSDSGLPLLAERGLAEFSGKPLTVLLTAPVDDAGELAMRARSLLRESAWFVRCEGEADLARLNTVLRVGMLVRVNTAGSVHSGKYLVWNVRHTIDGQSHKMKFVLVRNAVGPAPSGGAGGLAALIGAL
jgi:phage protein D